MSKSALILFTACSTLSQVTAVNVREMVRKMNKESTSTSENGSGAKQKPMAKKNHDAFWRIDSPTKSSTASASGASDASDERYTTPNEAMTTTSGTDDDVSADVSSIASIGDGVSSTIGDDVSSIGENAEAQVEAEAPVYIPDSRLSHLEHERDVARKTANAFIVQGLGAPTTTEGYSVQELEQKVKDLDEKIAEHLSLKKAEDEADRAVVFDAYLWGLENDYENGVKMAGVYDREGKYAEVKKLRAEMVELKREIDVYIGEKNARKAAAREAGKRIVVDDMKVEDGVEKEDVVAKVEDVIGEKDGVEKEVIAKEVIAKEHDSTPKNKHSFFRERLTPLNTPSWRDTPAGRRLRGQAGFDTIAPAPIAPAVPGFDTIAPAPIAPAVPDWEDLETTEEDEASVSSSASSKQLNYNPSLPLNGVDCGYIGITKEECESPENALARVGPGVVCKFTQHAHDWSRHWSQQRPHCEAFRVLEL